MSGQQVRVTLNLTDIEDVDFAIDSLNTWLNYEEEWANGAMVTNSRTKKWSTTTRTKAGYSVIVRNDQ